MKLKAPGHLLYGKCHTRLYDRSGWSPWEFWLCCLCVRHPVPALLSLTQPFGFVRRTLVLLLVLGPCPVTRLFLVAPLAPLGDGARCASTVSLVPPPPSRSSATCSFSPATPPIRRSIPRFSYSTLSCARSCTRPLRRRRARRRRWRVQPPVIFPAMLRLSLRIDF